MMPFKISELSDFKNVRTLAPGAGILLADGDETTGFEAAPFMVIGLMGSTPTQPEDRGRFAEQAATVDSRRAQLADHDVRAGPYRRHGRI